MEYLRWCSKLEIRQNRSRGLLISIYTHTCTRYFCQLISILQLFRGNKSSSTRAAAEGAGEQLVARVVFLVSKATVTESAPAVVSNILF